MFLYSMVHILFSRTYILVWHSLRYSYVLDRREDMDSREEGENLFSNGTL